MFAKYQQLESGQYSALVDVDLLGTVNALITPLGGGAFAWELTRNGKILANGEGGAGKPGGLSLAMREVEQAYRRLTSRAF